MINDQDNEKDVIVFISKEQLIQSYFNLKIIPIQKLTLNAPFPSKLKEDMLVRKHRDFLNDYIIKDSGIYCTNTEIVKNQAGLFKEIAMQLAKNIFSSGSVISLSLPIRVFEEKSMLERYCDWWVNAPSLLKKAGGIEDPIESFKLVIAFGLSSLHFSSCQLKPFNPLIGETFQGELEDGSKVYLEHTSHHPCVSNFYVKDKEGLYTVSGYYDMQPEGTIKMLMTNSVSLLHKGKTTVTLKASKRSISYQIPKISFGGIIIGERHNLWDGVMKFEDKKNNLKAIIQFNAKKEKTSCFHDIYGQIFKHDFSKDKKKDDKDFYETSFPSKPFPDSKMMVSEITGSYLGTVFFDKIPYLDIKNTKFKNTNYSTEYILPSDPQYREDINWLNKANYCKNNNLSKNSKDFENYAQDWKLALESQQRYDKALREKKKKK